MFHPFLQRLPSFNVTSNNIHSIPLLSEPTNSPVALHLPPNPLTCPSGSDSLKNINSTSVSISHLTPNDNIQEPSEELSQLLNTIEEHLDFSNPVLSTASNKITHHLKFPNSELYQSDNLPFKEILKEFIFVAENIIDSVESLPQLIRINNDEIYDGMKIYLPHTPPIIAISKPALNEQAQFWQYLFQEPQTIVDLSDSNESYAPTSSQDFLLYDLESKVIKTKEEQRIFITPKAVGSSLHQILELSSTTHLPKTIDRIHFNKWPDFETISVAALQNLAKETIKIAHSKYDGKLIVHCQGGVGRTGTFITYLSVREQIKYLLKNNMTVSGAEIIRLISITNILGKLYRDIDFIENSNQLKLVFKAIINDVLFNKDSLKEEILLKD